MLPHHLGGTQESEIMSDPNMWEKSTAYLAEKEIQTAREAEPSKSKNTEKLEDVEQILRSKTRNWIAFMMMNRWASKRILWDPPRK